jgi:excisionase family DNA binding protein
MILPPTEVEAGSFFVYLGPFFSTFIVLERQVVKMTEKLLKATEVAEILDVSRSFAYRLLKQGEIPSVRFGRSVRVRPQDLDTFIVSNVSGHPQEGHSTEVRIGNTNY